MHTPILTQWNFGSRRPDFIRDECLHHIFEETVDVHPNNTAIIYDTQSVTYAEVEARANALAHYLRSLGVETGSCVGLYLSKSIDMYVSMLAILKAGAAYIPLDPNYPADRIAYILKDSAVKVLISDSHHETKDIHAGITVNVDTDGAQIATFPTKRLSREDTGVTTNDLVFVIYTSGSTGNPKGVMLEHKSICHLVRASQEEYGITSEDRVYQGISISFDFSLEEIWMAFSNGAVLVPATPEMVNAGPLLSEHLTKAGITALSCVPTLLTLMEGDIPTLRFINVGGEDCPQSLIAQWSKPGRVIFNTYGPTEACVNSTFSRCVPESKVTIGKPLPNYVAFILDEHQKPVAPGTEGELYIGGIGLARGYVNRTELTAEKFIVNPFPENAQEFPRLYRSGDLVKFDEKGDILFLGRIDTQVKIRGFRIELSEIESILIGIPNIKTAVASVYENTPGMKSIAAYIVLEDKQAGIDINKVRSILKQHLPLYMIPHYIEVIQEVPLMPNGKTDRKNLPAPQTQHLSSEKNKVIGPHTETEKIIAASWKKVFGNANISIIDHFFHDLGGHSLFAAKVISELRLHKEFHNPSVSDIYANPTIESLAAAIEARKEKGALKHTEVSHAQNKSVSSLMRGISSLVQGIGVYGLYILTAIPFIAFYVLSQPDSVRIFSLDGQHIVLYLALTLVAFLPFMLLFSILAKWIFIGTFKQGEYPLWGWFYVRFWFFQRILALTPINYLVGTPLMGLYLRLMGAKIGKHSFIGTTVIQAYDVLHIGDNVSIGAGSHLLGYTVEDGFLKIAPIAIGDNVFIGTNCVVNVNTVLEPGSSLGDLSMLSSNTTIPNGEYWFGSPATRSTSKDRELQALTEAPVISTAVRRGIVGFIQLLIVLLLPTVVLMPYLPIGYTLFFLYYKFGYWSILATPFLAPVYILALSLEIILLKKIVLNRVTAGVYRLDSLFYIRKWIMDQLMNMSLLFMNTLFATLYTLPYLRLLGAKIGKRVEVSTVSSLSPNLLEIKDEGFIADMASLGAPKVYMGHMKLSATTIGERTFVGNAALVSGGETLGNGCLIGVLSISPKEETCEDNTSWLGLPPIFLPKRDINTSFSEQVTYHPTRSLYAKRLFIEFFRVTLPTAINMMTALLAIFMFAALYSRVSSLEMILLLPILIFVSQIVGVLIVVALKWIVVGTYIPRIRPLWSTFVWRSEFITGLYEDVVVPSLLRSLMGTPFASFVLRLFGVKIGKRVYLDSTFITEFDLVKIGSDCAINYHSSLQTHLFEDRVMKMSYVDVGDRCTIGERAIVLYDTKMYAGSHLGSLSLLMKGESLPENTQWEGSPAKNC